MLTFAPLMDRMNRFWKLLITWRVKHINERQLILALSLITGLFSGIAAVILKNTLHFTHDFLMHSFNPEEASYLLLVFPVFGIFLTILFVRYIIRDDIGHGVSKILYAISKKNSLIRPHNSYSSIIASTLTIGFGGSVGSEAPIVLTGASIGSTLGHIFRTNYKTLTLLVGCGAAGAIAGIFKAPIAGILFTLEVLMLDLTMASLIPLLISGVTSASVAYFFMGEKVLFSYSILENFNVGQIPHYILLGVITGLLSVYFTRGSMLIEGQLKRITNPWIKWIGGGVGLSLLIFLFPPLYGEGYETLRAVLSGDDASLVTNSLFYSIKDNYWLLLAYLALILVFKVVAMALTNGTGGVGGIFAPTLFMGGITGFIAARLVNVLPVQTISTSNFALVGMAGLMAGVMHAPLTSIFLIAEITGGYALFIPLMITATISFLTIGRFEKHSLYHKRLAQRGELITHDKDKAVLSRMTVKGLIENNFSTVHADANLGELVKVVAQSQRNVFPVVDEEGILQGIIFINEIRNIIFKPEMYDNTYVRDLMFMPDISVDPSESMEEVAQKFSKSEHYNLPVLKEGKYIGFVSRARVFSSYRRILQKFSDE